MSTADRGNVVIIPEIKIIDCRTDLEKEVGPTTLTPAGYPARHQGDKIMKEDTYLTDMTKELARASIGMQAEANVTGKKTDTGMGKADPEQAGPGLGQDEASGSLADSECVTGLAGLTIGTECCKKNGEKITFGNFGNDFDSKKKKENLNLLLKCELFGENVCKEYVSSEA